MQVNICVRVYLYTCVRALRAQRLIQIPENIFNILEANGKANEIGTDTGRSLFLWRELGMRCAGGMNGERFCVTEICNVADQFQVVNKTRAFFASAFDAEAKHRARTLGKISLCAFMVAVTWQA